MNKLLTFILIILALNAFSQTAEVAFTIKEKDLIPEGIAYDPREKAFYLGSIHKRKIVKVAANGAVTDFIKTGQDEVEQVLGMKVDEQGKLWACNNSPEYDTSKRVSNVHVYDIKSGKLLKRYTLSDGKKHLFNDLHITGNGDAYITDSESGGVYVIREGSKVPEEFVKPGTCIYPNGITATNDDKQLILSTARGIMTLDLQTKQLQPLPNEKFLIIGMDGLYRYKNYLIGIQNVFYPEAVVEMSLSGDEVSSIADIKSLVSDHDLFNKPTTGVIVGEEFYFIANSQLLQIVGGQGQIKTPETLREVVIMRVKPRN